MNEKPFKRSEADIKGAVDRRKIRAENYLRDPDRSKELLEQAVKKANKNENEDMKQPDFWVHLKAFFRLMKAYTRREYTAIPWGSIVMVTAAILYFVSPIDMLFDWIPIAGFVDDAAVLVFVIRQIRGDLNKFQKWEQERENPPAIIDL